MNPDNKVIINAAITGCVFSKRDTPFLPVTLPEIVDCAQQVQTFFDNVRLPEFYLFGGVNKAIPPLERDKGKISVAASFAGLLGGSQRVYEQVVQYAKERIGGGRPIIQHANIAILLGKSFHCDSPP
jgi:alkylation response protein AidB-like acyl-CoA dehydrogenase